MKTLKLYLFKFIKNWKVYFSPITLEGYYNVVLLKLL